MLPVTAPSLNSGSSFRKWPFGEIEGGERRRNREKGENFFRPYLQIFETEAFLTRQVGKVIFGLFRKSFGRNRKRAIQNHQFRPKAETAEIGLFRPKGPSFGQKRFLSAERAVMFRPK